MPGPAQRHRLAPLHLGLLHAAGHSVPQDEGGVHLLVPRLDPAPVDPHERVEVGRGVEVVGQDAVRLGGGEGAVADLGRRPEVADRLEDPVEGVGVLRAGSRRGRRTARSLVRPTRNSWTSNSPPSSTTRSKTRRMMSESIRWPSSVIVSCTMGPPGGAAASEPGQGEPLLRLVLALLVGVGRLARLVALEEEELRDPLVRRRCGRAAASCSRSRGSRSPPTPARAASRSR